jgi:hypothetical protein
MTAEDKMRWSDETAATRSATLGPKSDWSGTNGPL